MNRASPLLLCLPGCCLFVALWMAAPTGLDGQHREVDLEERLPPSERRVSVPRVEFPVDSRFRRKTWSATVRSPVDESAPLRRARLGVVARRENPQAEPMERAPGVNVFSPEQNHRFRQRKEDWSPSSQKRPVVLAPLVRNAEVAPGFLTMTQFHQLADELSLADINRFQFHRNHPQEPGVPAVTAGGNRESEER